MASSSCNGYGGQEGQEQEDRLSSLPDVLLLYILSYIDTRIAVQCSVLSKRWVKLWTLLPVFNFDSSLFEVDQTYTKGCYFDIFIDQVLTCRNKSIKIDSVNIKVTDHRTMARVFHYALCLSVPNVSIDTSQNLSKYHTFSCDNSSDSLTSFSLKGLLDFGNFPKFYGLVSLRLERVKIVVSEPFSCFPYLEKLFLVNCKVSSNLPALEVIGFRLSKLTVSSVFYHRKTCYKELVLLTPNLVLLELDGLVPMSLEAFDELPILDTIYIDYYSIPQLDDNQQKLNLIKTFRCLKNAKRVHLSPSTLELLNESRDMLAEEPCSFWKLEYLNFIPPPNKPVNRQVLESVSAYLLKDSPQAVVDSMHR